MGEVRIQRTGNANFQASLEYSVSALNFVSNFLTKRNKFSIFRSWIQNVRLCRRRVVSPIKPFCFFGRSPNYIRHRIWLDCCFNHLIQLIISSYTLCVINSERVLLKATLRHWMLRLITCLGWNKRRANRGNEMTWNTNTYVNHTLH